MAVISEEDNIWPGADKGFVGRQPFKVLGGTILRKRTQNYKFKIIYRALGGTQADERPLKIEPLCVLVTLGQYCCIGFQSWLTIGNSKRAFLPIVSKTLIECLN